MSELQHKDLPENVHPWLPRELLHKFTIFVIEQAGSNFFLALVIFLAKFRENVSIFF